MRTSRRGGDALSISDRASVGVIRKDGSHFIPGLPPLEDGFQPLGWMNIKLFDSKGRAKNEYQFRNLVVNQGKNDILNVYFHDGTQTASTSWFMGLIDSTGFTGIAATDTASSHPGWTENTGYDAANRVAWGQGTPSGQQITNATPVTFNITAAATLKGGFIISNNVKGGTTGTLWAAALFTSPVPVNNGDQMKVTYNLSC